MSKTVITGATGFVGQPLCQALEAKGHTVLGIAKNPNNNSQTPLVSLNINANTEWDELLANTQTVIHLAARVHIMNDTASDPLQSFREINTTATLRLAVAAANAGVRRFIFLSSIKVNGEFTTNQPFDEHSPAAPVDPYGISKHEAEEGLRKIAVVTSMEVVIIRPPLIYGPGVKANFLRLLSAAVRGIPLPLAGIKNRRSLVALDNLVDFIITCIDHPKAANETFLISDGTDLSTSELIHTIAQEAKQKERLFSLPLPLMQLGAALFGKKPMLERLTQSLQIDSSKARARLQWQPPQTTQQAIAETVAWYIKSRQLKKH